MERGDSRIAPAESHVPLYSSPDESGQRVGAGDFAIEESLMPVVLGKGNNKEMWSPSRYLGLFGVVGGVLIFFFSAPFSLGEKGEQRGMGQAVQ